MWGARVPACCACAFCFLWHAPMVAPPTAKEENGNARPTPRSYGRLACHAPHLAPLPRAFRVSSMLYIRAHTRGARLSAHMRTR
eukprot:8936486-Alexandrium_andersonii.AAC.1